mmetsp:Transcript_9050/g.13105  ORF Transcript_9050/g.13105 Transcript_9050/m.13105 type:complete len:191 (+) Transcript_9050:172-744(+)
MTMVWLNCFIFMVSSVTSSGAFVLQQYVPKRTLSELQVVSFRYAGDIQPGKQTPQRVVLDESILKPDYAEDGLPKKNDQVFPWMIEVKSPTQIQKMRDAGRAAREVLDIAGRAAQVGISTDEIDAIVHQACLEVGHFYFSNIYNNGLESNHAAKFSLNALFFRALSPPEGSLSFPSQLPWVPQIMLYFRQ